MKHIALLAALCVAINANAVAVSTGCYTDITIKTTNQADCDSGKYNSGDNSVVWVRGFLKNRSTVQVIVWEYDIDRQIWVPISNTTETVNPGFFPYYKQHTYKTCGQRPGSGVEIRINIIDLGTLKRSSAGVIVRVPAQAID
jgi:hypothetical protein